MQAWLCIEGCVVLQTNGKHILLQLENKDGNNRERKEENGLFREIIFKVYYNINKCLSIFPSL